MHLGNETSKMEQIYFIGLALEHVLAASNVKRSKIHYFFEIKIRIVESESDITFEFY